MDSVPFEQQPAVYRIPPEVLEQIFLYCYHDNSVYSSKTEAPFNLSLTCSSWRDIVVCLPQLWSSFNIVFSHKSCRPSLRILDLWLFRSGNYPLSFSMIYRGPNTFDEDDFMHSTDLFKPLKVLVNHVSRWKHVYLDLSEIPHTAVFPFLLEDLPHTATIADLEIRSFEPHSRHNGQPQLIPTYYLWLSELLHSSPPLTRFACYGGGALTHLLSAPWNQITFLRLESTISISSCLKILHGALNLSECHLTGIHTSLESLHPQICVPQLRVLSLTSRVKLVELLDRLILPKLQHLEVYMLHARRWSSDEGLFALLDRSACLLSTLVLRAVVLQERVLENCLQCVSSSLTTLSVSAPRDPTSRGHLIADSVLKRLTWNLESGEELLCPHLENVKFLRCIKSSDGLLSDMIESRCTKAPFSSTGVFQASSLKHIEIELVESDHGEDMERLKMLLGQGLQGRVVMTRGVKLAPKKISIDPLPAHVPILEPPSNWK